MTLRDFARYYSEYVKEAALWLSLVQQQGPQFSTADSSSSSSSTVRDPTAALASLLQYHGRVFASLMLLHGDEMLHQVRVLNCDALDTPDSPEQVGSHTALLIRVSYQHECLITVYRWCNPAVVQQHTY
jgi:hypothetical protein